MNGKNITNWGVDSAKQPSGSTTRSLYEPGHRWHYKESGIVLKRQGIESRSFCFSPDESLSAAVAEDGGLVEICVFRSSGRRRVAPILTEYRNQEHYGIM